MNRPRHRSYSKGDFFLAPFAGKRRDLLMRLIRPLPGFGHNQWEYFNYGTRTKQVALISSCHRCSPSLAKRILKK